MSIYLNDWKDTGYFGMVADFSGVYLEEKNYLAESNPFPGHKDDTYWLGQKATMDKAIASDDYKGIEVLLASYSAANYSGDAFVLFRRDGKLYEVNASHCSCYGVEGQWEPAETTVEALQHRLDKGRLGSDSNEFSAELRALLAALTEEAK